MFGKDIGFYLFSLPAYVALKNWLLLLVVFSAAIAGVVYWAHGDIELDKRPRRLSRSVLTHASALLGLYFAVKAWSYGLDRYLLLYSDNGVVVGAGYTDLHVRLPVLWLLVGLAIACAIACWVNVRWCDLAHSRRRAGVAVRQLLRALPGRPGALPAPLREAERTRAGDALYRAQHRTRRGRPTTCSRSR